MSNNVGIHDEALQMIKDEYIDVILSEWRRNFDPDKSVGREETGGKTEIGAEMREIYDEVFEMIDDEYLALLAAERFKNFDPKKAIPLEEIDKEFGITPEMLEGFEEVEFE